MPQYDYLTLIQAVHRLFAERKYRLQPGKGVERAAARLADHRKAWQGVDLSRVYSRQQRRADERQMEKLRRSATKKKAMTSKHMGGAAACR